MDTSVLQNQIDATSATWRARAAARTRALIRSGSYAEASSIWSQIKPVYIEIQNNKCIFCERQFEDAINGRIEFDLEHFRPKSSVAPWPVVGRHAKAYPFATGNASAAGYYWLAYDVLNYAACCKPCNSNLKSNFFPIGAHRVTAPGATDIEEQMLCYPIGHSDVDPETLITFIGTTAVPTATSGPRRARGEVIIDFFELNGREILHRQRAALITIFGNALQDIADGSTDPAVRDVANRIVDDRFPHTNCVRSFGRLWRSDRAQAQRVHKACMGYFVSLPGTAAPVY